MALRHAGHCWRSRDELKRDVLLWIPTHGRAKAGRPARTYIQQLCEDTRCCPEDLPRAMNDREEWRERVRNIRATSAIWWWWCFVEVYGISTIVGLFKANHLYTYISIYETYFRWVLWHINHCWLSNAKSSLYICINIYFLGWYVLCRERETTTLINKNIIVFLFFLVHKMYI